MEIAVMSREDARPNWLSSGLFRSIGMRLRIVYRKLVAEPYIPNEMLEVLEALDWNERFGDAPAFRLRR
jgi:hypothetical protein